MGLQDNPSVAVVSFQHVWKRFGEIIAAQDLNLAVRAGEFLSFLGPSGCGKTTLLRMIAGFDQPSDGDVLLRGQRVNGVPAYKRPVNMVFQHYALFPHLNIADNVAYGLKQRSPRPPAKEIDKRLLEASQDLGASPFRTFRAVTLPLSIPGIATGCMLVFILLMGEFLIPALLGGGKVFFIGNALVDLFLQSRNWAYGSAVAATLVVIMLLTVSIYMKLMMRSSNQREEISIL